MSSVRIEDYYSDQDSPPPMIGRHGNNQRATSSNTSSPSRSYRPQRQQQPPPPPLLQKRRLGQPRPYYPPSDDDDDLTGSEEEDDEQELSRAMHGFGFQTHPPVARHPGSRPAFHRSSSDYGYFPQNHYEYNHDFSPHGPPMPPYLLQNSRYHPPPPPPPPPLPPAQWMPYPPMMLDDMSPHMGPIYQPQPFVRRSASSRSYNRRNDRPAISSRRQEMYMSHDDDNELEDEDFCYDDDDESDQEVYPPRNPPLSRQSSTGSSNGPRPFLRKRSNSLSAMPPHPPPFLMDSPRRQHPANYFYPPHQRMNPVFPGGVHFPPPRMVHSVPSSPQLSASSCSGSEDYPPQQLPPRRASFNAAPQRNTRNARVGRSMSFSGGFPPHAPVNMAPPPPAAGGSAGGAGGSGSGVAGATGPMPPMVLHPLPPPMAHPMMENNSRSNSIYGFPTGDLGGDFFDQMTSFNQKQQSATAPVTPIDNPTSASASASGDIPMNPQISQQSQHPPPGIAANMQQQHSLNMPMPPPPPPQQMHPWVNGFPTSPGDPSMFGNQQGMMQQHLPQMMLPAMFNNPMMNQNPMMGQGSMWNFMPEMMLGQSGALGGDLPLPFMYSSDPTLIAQAMGVPVGGGGPSFGMDGNNNMHSPRMNMNGNPSEGQNGNKGNGGPPHEEDMMRRAAGGSSGKEPPHGQDTMMPNFGQAPPPNAAPPMLKRGLSMLGGLFGGNGSGANRRREDFHGGGGPPHPMFGSFSAPIQAQSKKEAKLQRQYEKLGTFYCWRRMDIPDQPFESFSIKNQHIIKKKINKLGLQAQFMLNSDERLPGMIMLNLHQNRGGCLMNIGGEKVVVMLQIEQKSYGTSNYIFGGGGGGGGGDGHHQAPLGHW